MINKKGLQVSFGWLFAIIVGAFILFLAIYGVTKLIQTEEEILDARTGKEIGVLLNPLETGFATATSTTLTMPVESRIYNRCMLEGTFGKQGIKISQKSFGDWTQTDTTPVFYNKYIFSDNFEEGKTFYLFSKPFKFPFKVADLIYITSSKKKYCFRDLSDSNPELEDIYYELENLNQKNILVGDCGEGEFIEVCFSGGSDCDINVYYSSNKVEKKYTDKPDQTMYFYGDALMFAAIFSDQGIYDCQLTRLMKRVEQLAFLYQEKADFISRVGCSSNLNTDLISLTQKAQIITSSEHLSVVGIKDVLENLEDKNKGECKLW